MKPHPECYLPALKALPAAPGRTLMVGDDLKNDVKGAKALGLRTAWLAPQARDIDPDVDIHLNHLGELPAHCERLFS
jgi:putative hydrolase of the HAD superfamily